MVEREDVIKRLAHFGYEADESDYDQLDFEIQLIKNYTLNYCHISEIPEIVEPRMIDRICSQFLFNKKNSGTLKDFDYSIAIKRIKEGDTTIDYSVGGSEDTPENRFDALVKRLERGYDKWLVPFRRLLW